MARIFTLVGLLALASFAWGQYRSWSLFDDVSTSQPARGAGNASRFYHK